MQALVCFALGQSKSDPSNKTCIHIELIKKFRQIKYNVFKFLYSL